MIRAWIWNHPGFCVSMLALAIASFLLEEM